ncbi:MAG: type II secretion system protein [Phycisphaerae bacterium]
MKARLPSQPDRHNTTIVELLIVVLILAIVAAVVVPQFSQASQDSRAARLRSHLATVRHQIERYRQDHGGRLPSAKLFVQQMTGQTDELGRPADSVRQGRLLGPYLRRVPLNPYTAGCRVGTGPVGSSDWFYEESTGQFRANHSAEHRRF